MAIAEIDVFGMESLEILYQITINKVLIEGIKIGD